MTLRWTVYDNYELVWVPRPSGTTPRGSRLLAIRPQGAAGREYAPLENTKASNRIFRDFSTIEMTSSGEGYLNFARQYGLLGISVPDRADGAELVNPMPGILSWADEVQAVWRTLARWHLLADRDLPPGVEEQVVLPHGTSLRAGARVAALQRAVREDTQEAINRHQLLPRIEATDDQSRFRQSFEPTSLIGAIWMQVIRTIIGGATVVPCEGQCGTLIEIRTESSSRRTYRADARFCSHNCRSRHEQRMLGRARQMKSDGRTIPEIAAATKLKDSRIRSALARR